jgi:dihydroxyacetone kinase
LLVQSEYLTGLDQAMGDGDLGINLSRISTALQNYIQSADTSDLGKFIMQAGMETNKAAPSTMGTLLATALMRAGKEVKGLDELSAENLSSMLNAAAQGMQERGKASLGDKTILDALIPAAEAFSEAVEEGAPLDLAGEKMFNAALDGRDKVTPLRSKIGRASWVGERTEGRIDPGCETLIVILRAVTRR